MLFLLHLYGTKIAADCGGIMVQDTSWEGYEEVPLHIMQGYTTMGYEIIQQCVRRMSFCRPEWALWPVL